MRQRRLERGDRGGGAAAGAAGDPVEVPRVVGGAVRRVLGGGAHRELVHVGLAEDRQAGGAQPGDDGGVVRRHPALEDLRAAGGGQPAGGQHVLDRDRDAVERRWRGCRRRGARRTAAACASAPSRVDVEEGVDGAVDRGDPVEVGPGQLDLVVSPAASASASSAAVLWVQRRCAHCSSPRIRGTANRCCSVAGAPDERLLGGQAGRPRRPRGTRWSAAARARSAVRRRRRRPGSTATDSRITHSCGARWSSSASDRSIRARSARWATSSRVIEPDFSGMGHPSWGDRGSRQS